MNDEVIKRIKGNYYAGAVSKLELSFEAASLFTG